MSHGKRKAIWITTVVAAAAAVWWLATAREPAQVITLTNGQKYQFARVTYGTNHGPSQMVARLLGRLPGRWRVRVWAKCADLWDFQFQVGTAEPSICVWLKPVESDNKSSTGPPYYNVQATLGDQAGNFERAYIFPTTIAQPREWLHFEFTEWPRRDRTLLCRIREFGAAGIRDLGTIKFSNPRVRRPPQWPAETLPAVKSAGDLRVSLVQLSTTTNTGYDTLLGETRFALTFVSPRPNETWAVDDAELSDGTGNRLSKPEFRDGRLSAIAGMLWPEESALRLKVGVKRISGFSPTDLITFSNVPLSTILNAIPTNSQVQSIWMGIRATNVVAGKPLVLESSLFELGWLASNPPVSAYGLSIEAPAAEKDVSVGFAGVVTDKGERLDFEDNSHQASGTATLRSMPTGTKFLNVTIAVQKKRYVEFLARPAGE